MSKDILRKQFLAIIALVLAAIFGGLNGIFAKFVLQSFTPFSFAAIRYIVVLLTLIPILFVQKNLRIKKKDIPLLVLVSSFWAGNQFLFLFAITNTTAIMSQVMYFLSPLIVLLLSIILYKQKFLWIQLLGVSLGVIGGVVIIGKSYFDHSDLIVRSLGSFRGNLLLLIAVFSWSLYLTLSKNLTKKYSPLTVTTYSNVVPFLISLIFFIPEIKVGIFPPQVIRFESIIGLLGLILGGSIIMVFLYQWGIKHSSPFAASSVVYLSPVSAAIVSIPILGERLTWQLIVSTFVVAVGVFFTTTYPLLRKRRN